MQIFPSWSSLLSAVLLVPAAAALASETYSPYVEADFPRNVYWGDTHVHSSWSPDAGGSGNEKLTPIDAFRFAKGEPVVAHNGQTVRLRRPLDDYSSIQVRRCAGCDACCQVFGCEIDVSL